MGRWARNGKPCSTSNQLQLRIVITYTATVRGDASGNASPRFASTGWVSEWIRIR